MLFSGFHRSVCWWFPHIFICSLFFVLFWSLSYAWHAKMIHLWILRGNFWTFISKIQFSVISSSCQSSCDPWGSSRGLLGGAPTFRLKNPLVFVVCGNDESMAAWTDPNPPCWTHNLLLHPSQNAPCQQNTTWLDRSADSQRKYPRPLLKAHSEIKIQKHQ